MANVHVSYSKIDVLIAQRIVDGLTQAGHTVTTYQDVQFAGNTPRSRSWSADVITALKHSDIFVILLSAESVKSQGVISELAAAQAFAQADRSKYVLPVMLDNVDIPGALSAALLGYQYIPNTNHNAERVIEFVNKNIGRLLEQRAAAEGQRKQDEQRAEVRLDSVVASFDFPPETRMACEQYLLYFVQFLKDLGIEANAELKHKAGRVLFAVTPTDRKTALDKIRQALEVYLLLPASTGPDIPFGYGTEPAIQQLALNIHHLKGQLLIAQTMLQNQQATIQAQQLAIALQRQIMTGEVVIDSMKYPEPQKPVDKEEILGGMAAIKKYEGKGFEVDLPKIFRWLKRLMFEEEPKKAD